MRTVAFQVQLFSRRSRPRKTHRFLFAMSSVLADARKFLEEEAASDLLDAVGSTSTTSTTTTVSTATTTTSTSASSDVFGDGGDDEFILSIVDDKLHGAYEQEKLEVALRRSIYDDFAHVLQQSSAKR